jgi:hypothetical protein
MQVIERKRKKFHPHNQAVLIIPFISFSFRMVIPCGKCTVHLDRLTAAAHLNKRTNTSVSERNRLCCSIYTSDQAVLIIPFILFPFFPWRSRSKICMA